MTYLIYVYVVVSILRLFKGFAAQPRLGVVTSTITESASDILHFLIVFASVFFGYALAGVVVFGRKMPEFCDIGTSMTTCWKMVFGDFDWQRAQRVASGETVFFFWTFTVLIVLIMLNMLLAIILDTYVNVKKETENTETLYSQGKESITRFMGKWAGKWLSLGQVRAKLLKDAENELRAEARA